MDFNTEFQNVILANYSVMDNKRIAIAAGFLIVCVLAGFVAGVTARVEIDRKRFNSECLTERMNDNG